MASSTMFQTQISTSSFLGTSMAKVEMGEARVSMMAFSRQELERKPLSLIRTLARQRGIRLTTKHEMINALAAAPYSYQSPKTSYSSAPAKSSGGAVSAEESALLAKTLGELRTMAKAKGLRGDTKAEIVKLLLSAGGGSSSSFDSYSSGSSSYSSAPAAASALDTATLERKSLSELRAMARVRGLRGDTKAELVKLLSSGSAPASAPATGNGASTSYYGNNGASFGATTGANVSVAVRQLSLKSLSQLRAMASLKGIRGTTKAELVKQLAATI